MKKALNSQLIRYLLSGITTFLIENIVFSIGFYLVNVSYVYANITSICIAVLVNFYINKKFVFKNNNQIKTQFQFFLYIVLVLINMVVSTWIIGLLLNEGIPGYIAKFVATAAIVFWTYIIYKKIIFTSKKEKH